VAGKRKSTSKRRKAIGELHGRHAELLRRWRLMSADERRASFQK
jgi:hypothetical protein